MPTFHRFVDDVRWKALSIFTGVEMQRALHRRKSLRLSAYDYSQSGAYFVTICTHNREALFGEIIKGEMQLTPIGEWATDCWLNIPDHCPNVETDQFVVMPNHVHGIIVILDDLKSLPLKPGSSVQLNAPTDGYFSRISPKQNSLAVIVRTYKGAVTTWCRRNGYPGFRWQRNYFEHIIRGERSLNRIREYIHANPQRWELDKENLEANSKDAFDNWLRDAGDEPIQRATR